MSGIIANAVTAPIALTASTKRSVIQLTAATNKRIKILGWSVFFDEEIGDATPANPLQVDIGRQTGGTGSGAITPKLRTSSSETLQTVGASAFTGVATTTVMESVYVNAQTGYQVLFPQGQEITVASGEKFGIDITPGATVSTGGLNVIANILFEE